MQKTAFTLLELMVVMIILAIIAVIVLPYAPTTTDLNVKAAARVVEADMEYAQSAAITTHTPITVTFSPDGNSYFLSNTSGHLINPITKALYDVSFSAQPGFGKVDLYSAAFGGNQYVRFDELGAPDNAGSVVLKGGSCIYTISVAPATGNVKVVASGS